VATNHETPQGYSHHERRGQRRQILCRSELARTFALGGPRVLLLDADLRRVAWHELMGLRHQPGLADLLRQPSALDRVIQKDSLPNLAFISREVP